MSDDEIDETTCVDCYATIGLDPDHEWPDGYPLCWSCLHTRWAKARAEADRLRAMLADVAGTLGCSDRDHNREWAEEIRAVLHVVE